MTGYSAYRRIQTETSSPVGLISLLLETLSLDLRRAEMALTDDQLDVVHERLTRAQEIVLELLVSLDQSYGEIPQQLAALYEYMHHRLVEANMRKDVSAIREVAGLAERLGSAWSVVAALSERAA